MKPERQIRVFMGDQGLEVHIDGGLISIRKPNWGGPEPPHSVTFWQHEIDWLVKTLLRHAPDEDFPKEPA